MKIKRFVAESMREALAQVRAEQGPDAVIITNRRIEGGIELITAIDYDESLIEEALKRARPAPAPVETVPPEPEPAAETRGRETLRERALAAISGGRKSAPSKPVAAPAPAKSTAPTAANVAPKPAPTARQVTPIADDDDVPARLMDGPAGRAAKAKAAAERAEFMARLARVEMEAAEVEQDYGATMVLPSAAAVAARGTARAPAAPAANPAPNSAPIAAATANAAAKSAAAAKASAAPQSAPAPRPAAASTARVPSAAPPPKAPPAERSPESVARSAAKSAPANAQVAAPAKPAAKEAHRGPSPAPRPQVVWSQDPELVTMRREVEGLRELLQEQLSSLAWSDRLRREPVRARVLRDLSEIGIAADVARALAERVPADAEGTEAWRLALALLMKHVPTVDDGLLSKGGTFAVVGPTGVGKTTTIAKLAARYALAHGAREVALVSLDHYRIGARDQLLTFARILGVTMHVATNARELGGVLASLADRRLVLIDTAGMSPRDDRLAAQFATLAVPGARIRTLLAIAANSEHLALDGIARSYAAARPEAILLTKLDEAASFGPALSIAMRHGLPLARLCDGQRVPEDLHAAPEKRVWLVRQAHKLAEQGRSLAGIDDAYMAERFGKVALHG